MTSAGLTQGILHLPGATPETKALLESLIKEDREKHHCFWGKVGFHNHLPHHLLAAYDLGASAKVLQAIYDNEEGDLSPINLVDRQKGTTASVDTVITKENWTEYLGQDKYYISYLNFFKGEVENLGPGNCIEEYIFSPKANGNESLMALRLIGGAIHPLIQIGYGVEFNDPLTVASGIAQTAVHSPVSTSIIDLSPSSEANGAHANGHSDSGKGRQPSHGPSLFEILRMMYDSTILHPVMPYDPDALLRKRRDDALKDGRPEEIKRLSSLWSIPTNPSEKEVNERIEEIIWVATLLMAGTGKPNRKPRLDFFLMHLLTGSLFLPSLVACLPTPAYRAQLLCAYIPVILLIVLTRGRPRIDPELLMSYSAFPTPPNTKPSEADKSSLGDPRNPDTTNPWPALIESVVHAPDAHTVKALRSLAYAAEKYGTTPAGGAIGAFDKSGKETHKGMAKLDGTVFVRAAGILLDTLGWVSHGQPEGHWDRSALGWDDAWKNDD